MENFNALLTLSEIKTLYSGKPVGICPLYKGVLGATKTFEATGNPIVLPEYKSLVKLTTKFSPKQAGSGDPSPENVRPISGWDEVTVNVRGKNLVGDFGEATATISGVTWTTENDRISAQGETGKFFSTTSNNIFDIVLPLPPGTYIINYKITDDNISFICVFLKSDNTVLAYLNKNIPYTLTENNAYVRIYAQVASNLIVNGTISDIQLEVGSTSTPYEPYQPGTTAAITFPETIYGGKVDAVTGAGSKTWGYITSYNGESLPGEWISDRDVYAFGTTPTTGAQVAYKLATPVPFKVTQFLIPSLRGENYFFTNGENMDIIYKKTSFWG